MEEARDALLLGVGVGAVVASPIQVSQVSPARPSDNNSVIRQSMYT
jgi:hypothetical protein